MAGFSFLSGHLGSSVSALVDGQLAEEDAERAWAHVATCVACRRQVEHEGWLKRQLAQIAAPEPDRGPVPPEQLLGSLLDLDATALAWRQTDEVERRSRGRRRAGLVLVGAGSVSAAVIGLSALGGNPFAPGGTGGPGGTPATSIGGARTTPTPQVVAPAAVISSRPRGGAQSAPNLAHAQAMQSRR